MSLPTPFIIDPDHAAFMQDHVSITVGSCSKEKMPSVTRAFGCRVSPEGTRVSLLVSRLKAKALLRDVAETAAIAVVFSEISTHRTIQIKGRDARLAKADTNDADCVEHHRLAFGQQISMLGFSKGFIDNLLECQARDLIKIEFSPCAAFLQTPGPNAGAALKAES